jgi:hypothetical protein
VPTVELQSLVTQLHRKVNVKDFPHHYVDLLNVASHEVEARGNRQRGASPPPRPQAPPPPVKKPPRQAPAVPDHENPATIARVGRSKDGAELVMTLGLGTFVVHRENVTIRYFDRGREWDVPDMELQLLIDSLMAKQDMAEHRYAYIDLLNVATFVRENRSARRR